MDGSLRVYAMRAPAAPIKAHLALLGVSPYNGKIGGIAPGGTASGITDHGDLTGRDAAQQHPISAITGLETAIASKLDAGAVDQVLAENIQEVTQEDVTDIWNSI